MNTHRIILWLTIGVIASGCTKSVDIEAERNALLGMEQQAAQAAGDVEKFAAVYAPDATIYPQGAPAISGTDAIKQFLGSMFTTGTELKITPARATVAASGDVGYATGSYTYKSASGATEQGKYLTVWKKQTDGSWKVAEDIFNADVGMTKPSEHKMQLANAITWGDPPPSLPRGAKIAVLAGNPAEAGPFTVRLQLPAGYVVPPHWHATDEIVTVLSGTVALGMGDKLDAATAQALPVGGFAVLPAGMHHYAMARAASTLQIHGNGPFNVSYVNPADDPSQQTAK